MRDREQTMKMMGRPGGAGRRRQSQATAAELGRERMRKDANDKADWTNEDFICNLGLK